MWRLGRLESVFENLWGRVTDETEDLSRRRIWWI